ncbi:hypothetical protein TRVL_05021 [Trypanosoma vivax]|uniref:Uncharacterized protein n=1 Tax=Trypanosoma vivax (strain Y486) TaxID=1055687 RepID=G0TYS6_TRYVY|nr:hypothetical protein TRVL_05021 [Trypanosoma vivax]CCC49126.1 hypothetical protein, unlikely [Trypanosoma vivax Y486]
MSNADIFLEGNKQINTQLYSRVPEFAIFHITADESWAQMKVCAEHEGEYTETKKRAPCSGIGAESAASCVHTAQPPAQSTFLSSVSPRPHPQYSAPHREALAQLDSRFLTSGFTLYQMHNHKHFLFYFLD